MPTFTHGRRTKIILDQYDVSPYFRDTTRTNAADEVDTTTYGADDYKTFIAGFISASMRMTGLFENTTDIDPGGAGTLTLDAYLDSVLAEDSTPRYLVFAPNGMAAGQSVSIFEATHLEYTLNSGIGDAVTVDALFSAKAPSKSGYSLHDLAVETGATDGTTVDANTNQAGAPVGGSTNGGAGQLHVTNNARAGATVVKIQHSDDGSTWVDLLTFDSVAAGVEVSQRKTVTGNVRRYLRASWTGTGSITFTAAFARFNG